MRVKESGMKRRKYDREGNMTEKRENIEEE
jgi:hypothetical protein